MDSHAPGLHFGTFTEAGNFMPPLAIDSEVRIKRGNLLDFAGKPLRHGIQLFFPQGKNRFATQDIPRVVEGIGFNPQRNFGNVGLLETEKIR